SGANNDGAQPEYPCSFTSPNILCVGAVDQKFSLASFSNYGATSVDIAAPGVNIVSEYAGTQTIVTDSFNTSGSLNWNHSTTTSGGWAYSPQSIGGSNFPVI